jgi:hypothetical protein
MLRSPSIHDGFAFAGHHRPPQLPGPLAGQMDASRAGALNLVLSGMPLSSAASMVNILNVEPAW